MGPFICLSNKLAMLFVIAALALVAPTFAGRMPYIINGYETVPGEFPWQASLELGGGGQHVCGAPLISDEWLVTASHCVAFGVPAFYFSVVLGAYDKDTYTQGFPIRYAVEKIIMHPDYEPEGDPSQKGDIALVKLMAKADLSSEFIGTIELAHHGENFDHMECVISGWGSLYGANTELPNALLKLPVGVLTQEECEMVYTYGKYHICVFNYGHSACTGDSGGPLACNKDGVWKLAGAASYVYGNCETRAPSVYTRISHYRQFIKKHTGV